MPLRNYSYFLIKLWNIESFRWVIKWIHYYFNEDFIHLIKKLPNLLLLFNAFVKDQEFGITWCLHAADVQIIISIDFSHIHLGLDKICACSRFPLLFINLVHGRVKHKIKKFRTRWKRAIWILIVKIWRMQISLAFWMVFWMRFDQCVKGLLIDWNLIFRYDHKHIVILNL